MLTRRHFLRLTAVGAGLHMTNDSVSLAATSGEPERSEPVSHHVGTLITESLKRDPASLNTDWFGTMLLHGLLLWSRRGVGGIKPFASSWFEHHLKAKAVSRYSGPQSRTVSAGGIPLTTYAGHYGLAFPCYEMARQWNDPRARTVCIDIAKIILHQASRNRFGLVAHDDHATFAIPDTCYFVAPPLMMAAVLDRKNETVFREQALYQLRTYIDVFLTTEKGLSKTILLERGVGNTCWTRASGWLLWAIIGVLRHLPASDPQFMPLCRDLKRLAEGIARVQDSTGGFHVLLDEPATPLESTGTAMFAAGLHEGIRRSWLPRSLRETATRAWRFVEQNITPEGDVIHAYTGWAVPAENRVMSMDEHKMEWIPGMILLAASELSLPVGTRNSFRRGVPGSTIMSPSGNS